jgi:hypothetical protein
MSMKRQASLRDETEYDNGSSKNRKRRKTQLVEIERLADDDLTLDEHFQWHRIRRLHRK